MNRVFADTSYWIATVDPTDQWSAAPLEAERQVQGATYVTTDFVLVEFLDSLSRYGRAIREVGIRTVRAILSNPTIYTVEVSRRSVVEALNLYSRRNDKRHSLTDCISMVEMRRSSIIRVLTSDRDFEQERFTILMRQTN
jgi:uncharacterized protein